MRILGRFVALATCALLLPWGPGPLAKAKGDPELKAWIEGPVRYIARKWEVKAYKALESDDARALFIEKFWHLRDPDPETLSNAYRHLFWERVNEANSQFVDSSKPGWLTDRGKIHILYGPPTDRQEDIHLRTDESIPGGGYGIIRWIYEGRPGERSDLDAIVVVPFVRDGSGEYRVSYDPNLSSVFFDAHAIRAADGSVGDRLRAASMGGGKSRQSVMLDLGKLQEVPPETQVLLERVETVEAYRNFPVDVRVDRYVRDTDRRTQVVITADLGPAGRHEMPAVIARVAPYQAEGPVRMLGEDSFRVVEALGHRVAQGRLTMAPGTYVLTLMVADPVKVRTSMHQSSIVIPPYTDRLRFSDVGLVAELTPLEFRSLASYDEPYVVGPFNVLPRLASEFVPGETVKLFYEVYGGATPYRISYQVEGLDNDGTWVALGQPAVSDNGVSHAQGWEMPTNDRWPLGDYRIRVEVTDASGGMVAAQLPFTLQDPARNPDEGS